MLRIAFAAFLAVVMAAGPVLAGQGGESRIYGPDGSYQGRTSTDSANPKQKSLYGPHGEYLGRAMTDDQGNTRVYDQHGRYLGRSSGGQVPVKPKP